jgi:hypothetical protein
MLTLDSTLLPVLCIGGVALIALVGMYRILTTDGAAPEEDED